MISRTCTRVRFVYLRDVDDVTVDVICIMITRTHAHHRRAGHVHEFECRGADHHHDHSTALGLARLREAAHAIVVGRHCTIQTAYDWAEYTYVCQAPLHVQLQSWRARRPAEVDVDKYAVPCIMQLSNNTQLC